MEKIGLGGGCHWCTEGVFQSLRGVAQVDQGFVRSDPPADGWAEGVIVQFDASAISLGTLIEVHLRTHSAFRPFTPTAKYRSAVYVFDEIQQRDAAAAIAAMQPEFEKPIETRILAFRGFKLSDPRFLNYYQTDPERPFCRRYIDPKLEIIRRNFAEHAR
jgi:peptide-methionine (S)-S-oxide reductase